MSISFQCRCLGISRSTLYYKARGIKACDVTMMNMMDCFSTEHPTSGARTLCSHLRANGHTAGLKHVRTLMRRMGISAIYPQKSLSNPGKAEYKQPYLLRGMEITHFGQVWSMDISYIPMATGFMYMVGIIDVYSRMLVGWRLTNTLDSNESVETLMEAVRRWGVPEIVNTDQGCQYTCKLWSDTLSCSGIRGSMDGRGRCKDNIWIERFWRSLKRECVYLNPVDTVCQMRCEIARYIDYNTERPHQGIGGRTPAGVCPEEIINNIKNNRQRIA